MKNLQITQHPTLGEEFKTDPRWKLIERILQTGPFQKSSRLPTLLSYLADHSIRGSPEELTEQRIGTAVFGKPSGYSPAEDSAVRVHVRQLRLRLHEYFACEGRDESFVVDIPKGSYELIFHSAHTKPAPVDGAPSNVGPELRRTHSWRWMVLFWVAATAVAVSSVGWYRAVRADKGSQSADVPWPVSAVIQKDKQTKVVVSDGRLMLRLLADRKLSLDEYLQPGFLVSITPPRMDGNVARLVKYVSDSQVTSFADTMVASTFVKLAGSNSNNLIICTARDLNRRDMENGNFIFVGGPTSNPWVSLYADKLNFEATEESVGGKAYFLNKKPLPGERTTYEGLPYTGSGGEDYATISLLPSSSGQGNVLILQGLREEGTEALGILLADDKDRAELENVLKSHGDSKAPTYFEALIRAQTVAGAPVSISIVATRVIPQ